MLFNLISSGMSMKKLLLLLFLLPLKSYAADVIVDGINFNLDFYQKTAEVARATDRIYTGEIVIPNEVVYNDVVYRVTSIGDNAFLYSGVVSVKMPNSITTISYRAFGECKSLVSVVFSDSLSSLASEVFSECVNLKSVELPHSLVSIGQGCFSRCSALTSIVIPDNVISIAQLCFADCSKLSSVKLSKQLETLQPSLFRGCTSLTSISIPASVSSIGAGCFSGCSNLSLLDIPNSVRTIGSKAFVGCASLKEVYCHATQVPITPDDAFNASDLKEAELHVPEISMDAYKTSSPWSYFNRFVALSGYEGDRPRCAKPTISYENGRIIYRCETEGVVFNSAITDSDVASYDSDEIELGVTYIINVCASKEGYDDSELATASLCWIDVDPAKEGFADNISHLQAKAVLVQACSGNFLVTGPDPGTLISVYNLSGQLVSTVYATPGTSVIGTQLKAGELGILKVGEKSIKVIMK